MRVTMSDVAHYAGVNKATVSRALKGDSRISAATREKVWEAAKSLGYEPDAGARGLSSHYTGMAGIVFTKLGETWTGAFLEGLERVLFRQGIDILVKSTGGNREQRSNVLRSLRSRRVDGIIWVDKEYPGRNDSLIPVVSVGPGREGLFSILPDLQNVSEMIEKSGPDQKWLFSVPGNGFFHSVIERLKTVEGISGNMISIIDHLPEAVESEGTNTVVCGFRNNIVPGVSYVLDFHFFEIGSIAGRLFLNAVRSKGVRPATVLVKPTMSPPE